MTKERCENCRFWDENGDEEMGACRRNAPTAAEDATPVWPWTDRKDWCGEYQPRKPLPIVTPEAPQ